MAPRTRFLTVPEFAPYIGVTCEQSVGDSADFARAAGDDPGAVSFLAGVRLWF